MLFRTAVVLALVVACRAADRPTASGLSGTSDVSESTTAAFTPAPGEWPFTQWRIAQAYTFNFVPAGPGHQLSLYNPATGWNESVRSRHRLGRTVAREIAEKVTDMKGTAELSKCPFPRHGIAHFDVDRSTPVAVVSVCFTCEDIFVWPDYEMTFEERYAWDEETDWLVRGDAISAAFRYLESVFIDLHEPVWHNSRAADDYFRRGPSSGLGQTEPPRRD